MWTLTLAEDTPATQLTNMHVEDNPLPQLTKNHVENTPETITSTNIPVQYTPSSYN